MAITESKTVRRLEGCEKIRLIMNNGDDWLYIWHIAGRHLKGRLLLW